MYIVIACDSFKGSIDSLEAGNAAARGIRKIFPGADIRIIPIADGGEGTVKAVLQSAEGELQYQEVLDPLKRPVQAFWGRLANGSAVIEMAAASGLPLLDERERNPLQTNSYGTGQLIKAALDKGIRNIMVGLGGSATNDGGVGMAQALGARFLNQDGGEIEGNAGSLAQLSQIDLSLMDPRLTETELLLACDVRNPLLGETGASFVYGPQKGGTPEICRQLEQNLEHLARLCRQQLGKDWADTPGAGAAGGLGFGALTFCNGKLLSGIDTILRIIGFDTILTGADLVITGEGRLDGASQYGKVPIGIAQRAQQQNIPTLAIVGELGQDSHNVFQYGITALQPTVDRIMDLKTAMSESAKALENAAERAMRCIQIGMNL